MTHAKDETERQAYLKGIVLNLPDSPGCYQYLDENGTVIYVGKAKKLKRRVSSYFNKEQPNVKTRILVSKICDIKYVVVKTEEDALLLENNLIKHYKPRYNVLLKDDKTYPSICITNEFFPRIFKTRQIVRSAGTYYGPYSHVPTIQALLDLIRHLFHPRPCRLSLTPEGIREGKYKECLEYHLHNCQAPCIGRQNRDEYMQKIEECREILRGNIQGVSERIMAEMQRLAEELKFEEAQSLKEKYVLIENFRAKSQVVSRLLHNIDVFSLEEDEKTAFVNYLHVTNGAINQAFTFEYKKRLNENRDELLGLAITEMRKRYHSLAKEIIVPFLPDWEIEGVEFTVPQRGEKRKLLELSQMNVKQYRFDRLKQSEKLNPEQKMVRLMQQIKDQLHLPRLPMRVELFDNSNISGSDAVAGCVVFEKLRPAKKQYRTYQIKTVCGPDDYASMHEVVLRRYRRAKDEETPLPDLIITDGGKGQMEVVRHAIEDELHLSIPIAGLAKDNRHRTHELLYGFPPMTIGLKTDSELFKLLTRMQDEVHRFAITYHRNKRSKRQTASELDSVPGIGEKTKHLLLKELGSVKRIKEAPAETLCAILGSKRGDKLYHYLHAEKGETAGNT